MKKNLGTFYHLREDQIERIELEENGVMQCTGKKKLKEPGGENMNCDMRQIGGRKNFQKLSSDEIGTQHRKGPFKKDF